MPLAFTLGLIAGLFDSIPNFGSPVAALPALLIAFVQSPVTAVWVALIYLAVQVCENHLLTPLVQRRASGLPPALIIFSQALMAALFGLVGVIFATPLAAAARVAVKRQNFLFQSWDLILRTRPKRILLRNSKRP